MGLVRKLETAEVYEKSGDEGLVGREEEVGGLWEDEALRAGARMVFPVVRTVRRSWRGLEGCPRLSGMDGGVFLGVGL